MLSVTCATGVDIGVEGPASGELEVASDSEELNGHIVDRHRSWSGPLYARWKEPGVMDATSEISFRIRIVSDVF